LRTYVGEAGAKIFKTFETQAPFGRSRRKDARAQRKKVLFVVLKPIVLVFDLLCVWFNGFAVRWFLTRIKS
jgi:hypothetical protein